MNKLLIKPKVKFSSNFSPRDYLIEYYSEVGEENAALLSFFAEAYKSFPLNSLRTLEVGGGPTLYQLISLSKVAKEIYFTDYLETNLSEVKAWVNADSKAYNWDSFINFALKMEQPGAVLKQQVLDRRKSLIRQKVKSFMLCDIFTENIVEPVEKFDLVSTNFVAESVSSTKLEVREVLCRFAKLLNPGGYLVMTGLHAANYWQVFDKKFHAVYLTQREIQELLEESNFCIDSLHTIGSCYEKDDPHFQGYEGIFMVKAKLKS